MENLFQLAARVRIQLAFARENMQRLQQRLGFLRLLARPKLCPGIPGQLFVFSAHAGFIIGIS